MLFQNVFIEDIHYLLPESTISSEQIEKILEGLYKELRLPYGTLESLTGVHSRRLWPSEKYPSYFSSLVGAKLLKTSQQSAKDIDVLIYAGVCRDFIEPATAHKIHHNLNLRKDCLSFDLSNACVGFLSSMLLAAKLIESKQSRSVLVVAGENAAPLLENTINHLRSHLSEIAYKAALASLTLGSGAIAILLTHREQASQKHRITGAVSQIASEHYELCQGEGDYRKPLMRTDSPTLLKEGVALSLQTWGDFLKLMNTSGDSFKHVFTHQVSIPHQERIFAELKIPLGRSRQDCRNLGNTGSVAAPLSLALAEENGSLAVGDKIALLGIGSGLNTVMMGLEW